MAQQGQHQPADFNPYAAPAAPGPIGYGPAGGSGDGAYLQGDVLVCPKQAHLPELCLKCARTDGVTREWQKFEWVPAHGRFFGVLGVLLTRKRGMLQLPLCGGCRSAWKTGRILSGFLLAAFVLFLVMGPVLGGGGSEAFAMGSMALGFAAFVAFLVVAFAFVRPRAILADKIDDRYIWLKGLHPQAAQASVGARATG